VARRQNRAAMLFAIKRFSAKLAIDRLKPYIARRAYLNMLIELFFGQCSQNAVRMWVGRNCRIQAINDILCSRLEVWGAYTLCMD
jgi:hypothetical protein